MANWQRTINLVQEFAGYDEGTKSVAEVAKAVAEKLKVIREFNIEDIDNEKLDIIEEFESLAADEDAELDDFNYIMNALYDWADRKLDDNWNGKKVAWIEAH
jgi:hypothetical protein